jgi:four helix bundle protein
MEIKKKVNKFTEIIVWQKGHELVLVVYKITKTFPSEEKFGLVSQMQRSAVSITSNISEGFGRRTSLDKKRFYDISMGSIYELQNQLIVAKDIHLMSRSSFESAFSLSEEVQRLLISWIRSLPQS